ncbi:hypothetical protein [Streptomyces sp. NPDC048436]|uniref:hypothetical protein n=1 Tax=Streptomyces sp. NPDC048436 TaxID=3365550 RepID=UPI00371BC85B
MPCSTGGVPAARHALDTATEDEGPEALLNVRVLALTVLVEAVRQQGAEADELLGELEDAVRQLVRLFGERHPKSLSAVVALAAGRRLTSRAWARAGGRAGRKGRDRCRPGAASAWPEHFTPSGLSARAGWATSPAPPASSTAGGNSPVEKGGLGG